MISNVVSKGSQWKVVMAAGGLAMEVVDKDASDQLEQV